MASNIRVTLEIDNKKYLSEIKAADSATNSFATNANKNTTAVSNSFSKLGASTAGLASKLDGIKAALAGIVTVEALRRANEYANTIKDIATTADVSIASVVGLGKAFEVNGGNIEGANNAILKFGQVIGDAVSGSDSAQKALREVGISLKDIQTLGQEELLKKAIDGIAKLDSVAMRAKTQTELFGKAAKSVSFPGVAGDFGKSVADAAKYESAIQAGSDASESLKKNLGNLTQALLNVAEPLNKLVAGINITVEGFQTFLKIIAAVSLAYFAFGKATSFVWTTFDGVGKAVRASGGVIAMVGAELGRFGSMIKSVFMNIGRAFGIFSTAYGGVASLGFALSGVLRIGLRFAGWIGIFTAIGEAINWVIKQITGFDVLDAVGEKISALYDKAKKFLGLGSSKDTGSEQSKKDAEAAAKSAADLKKKQDEAAAKAKEFAERQSKLRAEVEKTGEAYDYNHKHRLMDLELEALIVGKTEDQVELYRALDAQAKNLEDTIRGLNEKRKEWAKGTEEQRASLDIIDEEIEKLYNLSEARRNELTSYINSVQGARMIEKARLADIENLTKAIEQQAQRQEALAQARLGMGAQMKDIEFAGSQQGKSPFAQQAAQIVEDARKAALEAGRAFAAAFEDTGDGMTPERAQELADGLAAIADGYKAISDAQLKNLEASRTWSAGWKEAFSAYADDAMNAAMQSKTYFDTFTKGMEDVFVRFVQTGKLSFKDLANSLIADFARIQAKKAIAGLFSMGGGAGGAGGAGIFSSIGKIFGFADGGNPPIGVPSIVGENGPEMIVPRNAGTVIPNHMLGGQPSVTNITYTINATDAQSFKQQLARDPSFVHAVVEQGRRSTPAGARR